MTIYVIVGAKKTIHAIRNELAEPVSMDQAVKLCNDIYILSNSIAGCKIRDKKTDQELYYCGFKDNTNP